MKKSVILAAAVAVATAIAAPAMAETNFSVGYTTLDLDPGDLGALTGRAGWNNGIVGLEGEASLGVADDTIFGNKVELNSILGVFGVLQGELSPNFVVFGRAGFARYDIDVNGTGFDDTGPAYGVGANWFFDQSNGVRFEYTNYDDADSFGISYVRRMR